MQAHSNVNYDSTLFFFPLLALNFVPLCRASSRLWLDYIFFWRILEKLSLASVAAQRQKQKLCFSFSAAEERRGSGDKEGGRDNTLPQRPLPAEQ